jgi:predicted DNA-binding transcriptional regulator YafY
VAAVSGPHGGYRLAAGGALPPLLLDDEEAVAVALGLRAFAAGGAAGMEDATVAAMAKIHQVMPSRLRERIATLDAAIVRVERSRWPIEPVDPAVLVAVARACRTPERLRFAYVDGEGRRSERHVEPYQVVHASRRWYLVARDRDREAWRSFRVDRIADPALTGMRVRHVDPPDAAAFVAEGTTVGVYRWQARVLLHTDMEGAAELISPNAGVVEGTDNGVILRVGAETLDWIARYLASLACGFTVLDPPELTEALAELARRISPAQPPPMSV